MIAANSLPHFLQGPEPFPAESVIDHVAGLARNGAAIVAFADWSNPLQREAWAPDISRFPMYDLADPSVHNYLSQLADAVYFYGSMLSLAVRIFGPSGYEVCDAPPPPKDIDPDIVAMEQMPIFMSQLSKGDTGPSKAMTEEKMLQVADGVAERASFYRSLGFDAITVHMAYRFGMLGTFFSPLTNKRTDRYGGGLENRARFPLDVCRRIREVCGPDFLIEAQVSPDGPGGNTVEDLVGFAKLAEGVIDILQIRAEDGGLAHPIGYNSVEGEPLTLQYAEAIKRSGARIVVAPVGGFQDPADNDRYIREGRIDMVAMARAFICDPDYHRKIVEGRGQDVVPCIRCNKCHVPSMTGPWVSVCSVNPTMGIAHRLERMVAAPNARLKVAVVGGGPAGMQAAVVAAGRGHEVTLHEKSDYLGGQLRIADISAAKWPLRKFKDYLVRQLDTVGVHIRLNTPATPELVRAEGYDAVLVALGAAPNIPDIPGARDGFVRGPLDAYDDHGSLGHRVVVVGGSQTGTETGMFLAEHGHEVTVLTRQAALASDATPIHYVEIVREVWNHLEGFRSITRATTTAIAPGLVTYRDGEGVGRIIEADDIVLCGGMNPRTDEALSFYGSAPRFFTIGDCSDVGSVQTCVRSAFAAASQL